MPYLVYLARGRDVDKPAIVVLLDGDKAGSAANKQLKRGGPNRKQLIRPEYVVQINQQQLPGVRSDRPNGPLTIEDLVPIQIGVIAAKKYVSDMGEELENELLSVESVGRHLSESQGVFTAIQKAIEAGNTDVHIEKLGFARNVVEVCKTQETETTNEMRTRFAALFRHLTFRQRSAVRERERDSIAARVDREVSLFIRDKLLAARKSDVTVLLERISSVIDKSIEGDALVVCIRRLGDELNLDMNPNERIVDSDDLKSRIERLKYEEIFASQPDGRQTIDGSDSSSPIGSSAPTIELPEEGEQELMVSKKAVQSVSEPAD